MKVRVTTFDHKSVSTPILLFAHTEGAYVWYKDTDGCMTLDEGAYGSERVEIEYGDIVEIEWLGCEFSEDDVKIDMIRMLKARHAPNNKGIIASIHYGWTCNLPFAWKNSQSDDLLVAVLDPNEKQFDFKTIFQDTTFLSDDEVGVIVN